MRFFFAIVLILMNIVDLDGFNMPCPFSSSVGLAFLTKPGCHGTGLHITSRYQNVTSVNDQKENIFDGSTFKHISIVGQVVHFVPQKLGDFFKDLEGIRIYGSKLKEVEKKDFAQFPKLMECCLDNNQIQVIPKGLFDGNLELVSVNFYNNKVVYVAPNVFTPLKKLVYANFQTNTCTQIYIQDQSSLPSLEATLKSTCQGEAIGKLLEKAAQYDEIYLNLERKKLEISSCSQIVNAATNLLFAMNANKTDKYSTIPRDDIIMKCKMNSTDKSCKASGFYVRFPDSNLVAIFNEDNSEINRSLVEKLLIVDQQTIFLPKNLGSSFLNLKELTIINSGYFHMDKDILTEMPKLTKLTMNENTIRELPKRSQSDNDNLVEMNFAFNQIETIDDGAFVNLGNLRVLNLTANLLTTIRAEVFSHLNSLRVLDLQQNKLIEVKSTLFYGLTSLTHLDISNNKIKKLPGDIIGPGNKILEFFASANKLKMIDQKLLKRLKKSQTIDLTQNFCIDAAYHKNSDKGITLESMHANIFLECSDDDY